MSDYILELKDVVKTFGGVTALGGVHFQLKKGEIHALMGENGAGKSTFIKVITGVHQPDSGLMLLEGEKVTPRNTEDSAKLGIAAIYQHVTAFPDLTVTENIFMGQEIKNKFGFYNWPEMTKRAKELIAPLSKNIDVNKPMSALSVAQQQLVEIAKALSRDARILIMDEPTASLSKKECEELYHRHRKCNPYRRGNKAGRKSTRKHRLVQIWVLQTIPQMHIRHMQSYICACYICHHVAPIIKQFHDYCSPCIFCFLIYICSNMDIRAFPDHSRRILDSWSPIVI